ncbi:ABC transporter ATP-binding protein [Sphingobacterium rhinopitheci]|uniref:ABC transporter ATP-binding protein n=1 Tax=Sphingobacterium rhinopitheci TaxID=2781960 RepID=UPI001F524686|nr:ABC transporter ATP-binding protein [Sphingobacterium rhinopitheci]MCI0921044.1 ABC transporter ATP-binding protein [Sphingobacterium rhinopitheci]
MATTQSTCQYIPTDVQKHNVSLINGENISIIFEGKANTTAVDHVDFGIEGNKITAIIGESGSGKSTLLKIIYGLLEPSSGEVRYKGWLVPTRKDKLIPGHDAMKLVSQGFEDLNMYAKVWDNIASQLPNTDLAYKQITTQKMLERLKIDHLAQHRVADLSGGERQRVAIARALINDPEVLLMDEPFNQVDAAFRDALQQDIRQIVDELGLTVILVSHDPSEVLAMADQLIVMRHGKIVDHGQPTDLYYAPKHPYTAVLLAKSNILTEQQAGILDITSKSMIGIHQEWIEVNPNKNGLFTIKDIRFRGFYKEYVLEHHDINLHSIVKHETPLEKGTIVDLRVTNYITF